MRAWELNETVGRVLYHTTSEAYAREIMDTGVIKPKTGEAFVSFSKKPYTGDISHNEVTLKINADTIASDVMEVEYTERWYEKYPDHAGYIAGEGWREQFVLPDDCYDDEGEENQECVELAWRDQELESFLWKKEEEEVVSKVMGQPIHIGNIELLEDEGTGLDRVWLDHPIYGRETMGEYLERHRIPVDDKGMVTLYHAKPKATKFDVLRSGSYLTDDKEAALHFAARDRELKPNEVEVLTLYLSPDQIQPGGHMTLIGDYKL